MTLYLLDANVLITAHNTYYPIGRVPEFWDWLLHCAQNDWVKMPLETFEEVRDGTGDVEKDKLYAWLTQEEVAAALLLAEEVNETLVQQVLAQGYAPDLDDIELEKVGRDPFLIAYTLVDAAERWAVTNETPSARQRANKKIPDACRLVGTRSCNTFELVRALDFTTKWRG